MINVFGFKDILTNLFTLIIITTTYRSTRSEVDVATLSKEGSFKLNINEPINTIRSFCPVTFCSTNETTSRLDGHGNRCCVPCDCSRTCRVAGTDSENPDVNLVVERCTDTSVTNDLGFMEDTEEFLLIQSCPTIETEGHTEMAEKCLKPDETKMDEIIPVYSLTTGRNYRNIYCANCHHEYSVNAWKSQLKCPSIISTWLLVPLFANKGSDFLQSIRTHWDPCILQWLPAPGTALLCINQSTVISSCNPLHSNYEKFKTVCPEIYAPVRVQQTIYKNVFCLGCNEDINICKDTSATDKDFLAVLKSEVFGENQIYEKDDTENTMGNCSGDMVYDDLLGQCIKKVCPLTKVKAENTCVSLVEELSGIGFDYRLKVSYPKESFSFSSVDKMMADVRHLVLHNNDTSASLCVDGVFSVAADGEYVVITVKLTKSVTKPSSLYEDFRMFKEKVTLMNMRASNRDIAFTVEIYNSPFQSVFADYLGFVMYLDFEETGNCLNAIAVTDFQFCDMVEIKKVSWEIYTSNSSNGRIAFQPGEYIQILQKNSTDNAIYACYDLYVSKELKARSFVLSSAKGRNLSIVSIDIAFMLAMFLYI